MYRLKADIQKNDGLTITHYSKLHFISKDIARSAADVLRKRLFQKRNDREIKDYTVDIIPYNR